MTVKIPTKAWFVQFMSDEELLNMSGGDDGYINQELEYRTRPENAPRVPSYSAHHQKQRIVVPPSHMETFIRLVDEAEEIVRRMYLDVVGELPNVYIVKHPSIKSPTGTFSMLDIEETDLGLSICYTENNSFDPTASIPFNILALKHSAEDMADQLIFIAFMLKVAKGISKDLTVVDPDDLPLVEVPKFNWAKHVAPLGGR